MDDKIHILDTEMVKELTFEDQCLAVSALESGKVVYLPKYTFSLEDNENCLITDALLDPSHKNISFDYLSDKLGAFSALADNNHCSEHLHSFLKRYGEFSKELIKSIFPDYGNDLLWGRTSYRPAEIKGRQASKRKDDTRLHVDSFPGTPVYGRRILRVFTNINPFNQPRIWNLGEPFDKVLAQFSNKIPRFSPFRAKLLHLVKATKKPRSMYDHSMLKLHDLMKFDDAYQLQVKKDRMEFAAQSSWIVFTDQVSHAALSGQYVLEQTFYLPVEAMVNPERSPLRQWEKRELLEFI